MTTYLGGQSRDVQRHRSATPAALNVPGNNETVAGLNGANGVVYDSSTGTGGKVNADP